MTMTTTSPRRVMAGSQLIGRLGEGLPPSHPDVARSAGGTWSISHRAGGLSLHHPRYTQQHSWPHNASSDKMCYLLYPMDPSYAHLLANNRLHGTAHENHKHTRRLDNTTYHSSLSSIPSTLSLYTIMIMATFLPLHVAGQHLPTPHALEQG